MCVYNSVCDASSLYDETVFYEKETMDIFFLLFWVFLWRSTLHWRCWLHKCFEIFFFVLTCWLCRGRCRHDFMIRTDLSLWHRCVEKQPPPLKKRETALALYFWMYLCYFYYDNYFLFVLRKRANEDAKHDDGHWQTLRTLALFFHRLRSDRK